ncbi:MAG TPA: hypothetical protein VF746_26020 [Longimicrobium sp.]|jgi:hypothetical protein
MYRRFAAPLAALLLLLPGCDSPSLGETVDATGTWTGTAQTGPASSVGLTMNLTEGSGRAVTGTAQMVLGGNTLQFTVTGLRQSADLSLTFASGQFEPVVFSGEFHSRTELQGVLNQSGFQNAATTLTRQ